MPIASYGGDTAAFWTEVRKLAKKNRGEARAVERALRRLVRDIDLGGIDESPRIDGRRLVRELVTRRMALGRAVRREATMPIIVLACDVSGSCSAVCTETLAAALAIAEELPHVLVVRHSNGWVCDVVGGPAGRANFTADDRRDQANLARVVLRLGRPVAALIAWGDLDAGDDYQVLCEAHTRLFLLDSYAAKHGARPVSKNLRQAADTWRHQPEGWWQGVNNARSTVIALRGMT